MQITLKLFASLTTYLPREAGPHETALDIREGTTPAALLQRLTIPRSEVHLILINGLWVDPDEWSTRLLIADDVVAMWPPVAGG